MNLKDLVPPIVGKILPKVRSAPVFASYQEASRACQGYGYAEGQLLEVVFEKTRRFRDALRREHPLTLDYAATRLSLVISLVAAGKEKATVIDFGGACGAHYFTVKSLVKDRLALAWHLVETPAMSRKARYFENAELKAFDDLDLALAGVPQIDLFLSSGTLPYVPEPLTTLAHILQSGATYLYLTRLPLLEASPEVRHIITLQTSKYSDNGPGPLPEGLTDGIARYPITFLNKNILETAMAAKYDLQISFAEGIMHYFQGTPVHGFGYLAQAR